MLHLVKAGEGRTEHGKGGDNCFRCMGASLTTCPLFDWTMKELAALVAALSFLMIFMQTILLVSKSKHCTSEESQ